MFSFEILSEIFAILFSLECQDWIDVDTKDLLDSKNRYGHTGAVYNK